MSLPGETFESFLALCPFNADSQSSLCLASLSGENLPLAVLYLDLSKPFSFKKLSNALEKLRRFEAGSSVRVVVSNSPATLVPIPSPPSTIKDPSGDTETTCTISPSLVFTIAPTFCVSPSLSVIDAPNLPEAAANDTPSFFLCFMYTS